MSAPDIHPTQNGWCHICDQDVADHVPIDARLVRTDGLLSQQWRERHCEAGDEALREAEKIADREDGDTLILSAAAQAFAAIAQAHYAAANVRARPSS